MSEGEITFSEGLRTLINNIVFSATVRGEQMRMCESQGNATASVAEETMLNLELRYVLSGFAAVSTRDKDICYNNVCLMRDLALAAGYFNSNPSSDDYISMAAAQVSMLENDIYNRLGIIKQKDFSAVTSYTVH